MATELLGSRYYDSFLNDWVGEVSEETTTRGTSIDIIKPVHITFETNENFREALQIFGHASISLDLDIGDNLNVSKNVSVLGNTAITGNCSAECYHTLSDVRYKKNIKNIKNINISDIKVYEYNLIGNEKKVYGVIAQDLLKIPSLKHMVDDENKNRIVVDYVQFIPILIADAQRIERKLTFISSVFVLFVASFFIF
jgi:hypothetical protein